MTRNLWPGDEERHLLGRFYAAETLREVLNVIFPFQFVYLFLVVERPEWAVLPVIVAAAVVLIAEIPTGVVADRFGRKLSVLSGFALTAAAWALVPLSVAGQGLTQLLGLCACFALAGVGQTLFSGAEEAWVVDNLASAARLDLVDRYFARIRSFASLGGVAAGIIALVILLTLEVDRGLLDALWYIGAAGYVLSMAITATIPEARPLDEGDAGEDEPLRQRVRAMFQRRGLVPFILAITVASFSGAVPDEAFDVSLISRGMDARWLAALGVLDDLIGMIAPLIGVALARALGVTPLLVAFLVVPTLLASALLLEPTIAGLVTLWAAFDFMDDVWDPVAEAHLHALIPSRHRATLGSVTNQLAGLAETLGMGAFALIMGVHSEALEAATPDLVAAFSEGVTTVTDMPRSLLGLPLPDLIIALFVASGVAAVPFLLAAHRAAPAALEDPS